MTEINNLIHTEGTLIAESQATKATTSNSLDNLLSDTTQKILDITITGDKTLTDDEFFGHAVFNLSGTPGAPFSFFVPASGEHTFTVINGADDIATIDATGGAGTTVALQASLAGSFHSDGTDILAGIDPDIMRYSATALDETTDYFLFWDASTDTLHRILGENLPGSSSAGTGAFPFKGALVKLSGDTAHSEGTAVAFDAEAYDFGDWHDNVTENTRLTVPAGITKISLMGGWVSTANETGSTNISFRKNGVAEFEGQVQLLFNSSIQRAGAIHSHVISVVAGDYFEFFVTMGSAGTLESDKTFFSIRAIETTESGQTATVQTANADQTVIATGAMASDSAHTIRAYGQGREDATGDTYHFKIFAGARNEGGTSTAPTPNVVEVTDAGASTWDATLEANDTSDEWEILVTGEAAHTIDWTVTYFEILQEV